MKCDIERGTWSLLWWKKIDCESNEVHASPLRFSVRLINIMPHLNQRRESYEHTENTSSPKSQIFPKTRFVLYVYDNKENLLKLESIDMKWQETVIKLATMFVKTVQAQWAHILCLFGPILMYWPSNDFAAFTFAIGVFWVCWST